MVVRIEEVQELKKTTFFIYKETNNQISNKFGICSEDYWLKYFLIYLILLVRNTWWKAISSSLDKYVFSIKFLFYLSYLIAIN